MRRIGANAIVDREADVASDAQIGPGAIIGPGCIVGPGCVIGPYAILERNVKLGERVKVGVGTVLGGDPQDLKWRGEETWVEIGDRTVIREYSTVNRGTSESLKTTVGRDCFLMTYVHLAHDCHIGDGVIISNGTQLAGHVVIEDRAIVSGLCAVHQFVAIGRQAFVGGASRVAKDVPPFVKAVGNPTRLFGLNSVGLQRSGMPEAAIRELKRAYRLCFNTDELNLAQGIERARAELEPLPEVQHFLAFLEKSARGVVV
jgi:UDP-N-acetylglucosamine acyltransferase